MATAITALANLTLGGAQATVTFSSISGSYRDLFLVVNAIGASGNSGIYARVNGDSAANYLYVNLAGTNAGGQTSSAASASQFQCGITPQAISTTFISNQEFTFFDYAQTDKQKTAWIRTNNTTYGVESVLGKWANTAAITSIVLSTSSGQNFAAGSSFALYGVSA